MKYTLLEMVQTILSSMGSDEVNNITDTEESNAVALIIRDCYNEIAARGDFPEHWQPYNLEAASASLPIRMRIPDSYYTLDTLQYNKVELGDTNDNWKEIYWKEWQDFSNYVNGFNLDDDNVSSYSDTIDGSTIKFRWKDDVAPTYYSTYDDEHIVFDSYDSEIDAFLQSSKTNAFGRRYSTFTLSNTYVPDIDAENFPILLNEAKAQAFVERKQMDNINAERKARRGWIHKQKVDRRVPSRNEFSRLPDYGRKRR